MAVSWLGGGDVSLAAAVLAAVHVVSTSIYARPAITVEVMMFDRSRSHRSVLIAVTIVSAAALVLALSPAVAAKPHVPKPGLPVTGAPGRYIVTLKAKPVATYDGGVQGLAATRPSSGRKVEVSTTGGRRYTAFLRKSQDDVAARVGAKPGERYSVALNGFTATLTTQQARELQGAPEVLSVTKDLLRKTTNDQKSVDFLGLTGHRGVWARLGGKSKAGRGVVVGVIDTGIWPESRSFAGKPLTRKRPTKADPYRPYLSGGRIEMAKSDGSTFTGVCQTGDQWTSADCNTKIVSARFFSAGFEANTPPEDRRDFRSPRDGIGHGSHVASTAAGDSGVPAKVDGYSYGTLSGVAPAARIAVYKTTWLGATIEESGAFTSDLLDALDAAVADGVDVLNYSIGGQTETAHDDPVQLGLLSAASAGIFVAASAGNFGPAASSLDNTPPWVTTVAASTIKPYEGTVVLGNHAKFVGPSKTVRHKLGPKPLVTAVASKTVAASAAAAAVCGPETLDPAKAQGKVVVCDLGAVDPTTESAEVQRAGGVGMVLVNLTDDTLSGDIHPIPTVMLGVPDSLTVKQYAETPGATATLVSGNRTQKHIPYPQIAGFSSRGPSTASGGDLVKPDIAAPGVDILGAVAPASDLGRNFDFVSGTSMAAPHISGLAAIYLGVHPTWAPMTVKSALMTTAVDTKTVTGQHDRDPFAQGAGEVWPKSMLKPGLVFNASEPDWLAYLKALGLKAPGVDTHTAVAAVDPSDYNAPSIAVGQLLDRQTVTRRVTAVKAGRYRAVVSMPKLGVRVTPSVLRFTRPGQTRRFTVRFSKRTAPFDVPVTGFLTWIGAHTRVRMPMAVTPKVLTAPEVVQGSGGSGTIRYQVTPGVAGRFPIAGFGLAAGTARTGNASTGGQVEFTTNVAAGAKVARFSVRPTNPQADPDLTVFRIVNGDRVPVGQSVSPAANETVTIPTPEPGTYLGVVDIFADPPGASSTSFTYRDAVVGAGPGLGNFTVTPTIPRATIGVPIDVTAAWSGLNAATPYLGYIEYPNGSATIVTVN
jgi:subtilisin family serine protease